MPKQRAKLAKKVAESGIDAFDLHAAMDRAFIARDFVEGLLAEHPAILLVPDAAAAVRKASDLLFDAYLAVGREVLKDESAPAAKPKSKPKRPKK